MLPAGQGRQQHFPQGMPGLAVPRSRWLARPARAGHTGTAPWQQLAWPPGTGTCCPECAPNLAHLWPPGCAGLESCSAQPRLHFPELSGCFCFLTCSDSSSFMSSFGGNKSLAWMYSKLGGPSSPCIANRAHSQPASARTRCESQKLKLLDTSGSPGAWGYLCMEMSVLPSDPRLLQSAHSTVKC